jgi:hypothetical protein
MKFKETADRTNARATKLLRWQGTLFIIGFALMAAPVVATNIGKIKF